MDDKGREPRAERQRDERGRQIEGLKPERDALGPPEQPREHRRDPARDRMPPPPEPPQRLEGIGSIAAEARSEIAEERPGHPGRNRGVAGDHDQTDGKAAPHGRARLVVAQHRDHGRYEWEPRAGCGDSDTRPWKNGRAGRRNMTYIATPERTAWTINLDQTGALTAT